MADGIPDYDELKLRIEPHRDDGAYLVTALGPDGSAASGRFSVPFDSRDLALFVSEVGRHRLGVRAFRSSRMEKAKEFGAALFDALVKDDVRDVYQRARTVAESRDRGLRVTLSLTGVPQLMEIPWEFLYSRPSFLSQSIYTPLVRSLDLPDMPPPRAMTFPLRVLGMVSHPDGFQTLDVDAEKRKLEQALQALTDQGLVEVTWLERATLSELDRVIGAPDEIHVLHYIGHGAYDERTQAGILVLENERGGVNEVSGEDLGALLYDERSLRLVVLNSCEGARSSHVDPFSGVASSLVETRIPAVIGMQFEITDQAAITFADRLYTALAQGFPVDAAVANARRAIFAAGHDIEFGTPVLFLRAAGARLFEPQGAPKRVTAEAPVPPPDAAGRGPGEPRAAQVLLGEAVGLETRGGVMTKLFERGSALPSSRSEIFSTAEDDQPSVELHLLQGNRAMAEHCRSLGKFQLTGIAPAPRGIPQIEVTFRIDDDGKMTVIAKDLGTGHEQRVESRAGIGSDRVDVERIFADGAADEAQDRWLRELADARNAADQAAYDAERELTELGVPPSPARTKIEEAIRRARETVQSNDVNAIRDATETLRAFHRVTDRVMRQAQEHLEAQRDRPWWDKSKWRKS